MNALIRLTVVACVFATLLAAGSPDARALSYAGFLSGDDGDPFNGVVDVRVDFYDSDDGWLWGDVTDIPAGFADGVDNGLTSVSWDGFASDQHVVLSGADLLFTGINIHIRNNQGKTWGSGSDFTGGTPDGVGNLIIGYNEAPEEANRSGSHNLVIGPRHNYTSFGGFVAGRENTISGIHASVLGGRENSATGIQATVGGGYRNWAEDSFASVSGGANNVALDTGASVSGGNGNTARVPHSSVSGGTSNVADSPYSSISGGYLNNADGSYSTVSGGQDNTATFNHASVSGGSQNTTSGQSSAVSGGAFNVASGSTSAILGGFQDSGESDLSGSNDARVGNEVFADGP